MAELALRIEDLRKTYGDAAAPVEVLRAADLVVGRGEMVALVAPSGAGKSTLLHLAGLLDTPDAGLIRIAGVEAPKSDAARTALRRTEIGFVYQFHHLLPEFTALENIVIPQRAAGRASDAAEARALDLLQALGLENRADHRPGALSGGEQQRVAIGRALANQPRLLLADEPTGNLDPATAERVFSVLLDVAREQGAGALIATHNPALARRMDRIVSLSQGRIVPGMGAPT